MEYKEAFWTGCFLLPSFPCHFCLLILCLSRKGESLAQEEKRVLRIWWRNECVCDAFCHYVWVAFFCWGGGTSCPATLLFPQAWGPRPAHLLLTHCWSGFSFARLCCHFFTGFIVVLYGEEHGKSGLCHFVWAKSPVSSFVNNVTLEHSHFHLFSISSVASLCYHTRVE